MLRSNHPHIVFSAMEKIMTLVIDESEEISLDLLSPLLSSVRKENQVTFLFFLFVSFCFICFVRFFYIACALLQNNSPISWKLGEEVITKCAAKLTPYLRDAVKSMHFSLADYAQIVGSICQNESADLKHNCGSDSGANLVGVTLYN